MIILAGDLNVNGSKVNKKGLVYREILRAMHEAEHENPGMVHLMEPAFYRALDAYDREYQTMMDILSNKGEDEVIDVMKLTNDGEAPITFADIGIDENGHEYPLEMEMVCPEDHCSK
jgi:hypothetical protein